MVQRHPQDRARCFKLETTGLSHLSDEIRFETARPLLEGTRMPLTQIAAKLEYLRGDRAHAGLHALVGNVAARYAGEGDAPKLTRADDVIE